jgi:hypothetical protein
MPGASRRERRKWEPPDPDLRDRRKCDESLADLRNSSLRSSVTDLSDLEY